MDQRLAPLPLLDEGVLSPFPSASMPLHPLDRAEIHCIFMGMAPFCVRIMEE